MSNSKKPVPPAQPAHDGKGFFELAGEAFSVLGGEIAEGKDKIVEVAAEKFTAVKKAIKKITHKKAAPARKKPATAGKKSAPARKTAKKGPAKKAVKKAVKKVGKRAAAAPKKAAKTAKKAVKKAGAAAKKAVKKAVKKSASARKRK